MSSDKGGKVNKGTVGEGQPKESECDRWQREGRERAGGEGPRVFEQVTVGEAMGRNMARPNRNMISKETQS